MAVTMPKHADDVSSLALAIQDAVPYAFIILLRVNIHGHQYQRVCFLPTWLWL